MNIKEFISCMNYDDSPFFLSDSHLYEYPGYAHIFRLSREKCGLHGVYTLKTSDENHPHQVVVPIVYICQADSEQQAREFHRLIWNQNIVPFIIVLTTKSIHLYPGFNFNTRLSESRNQSILEVANDINVVLERLSDFKADSIDRGILWQNRKKEISQDKRVDRVLLRNLNSLSSWLRGNGLSRHTAHSLIGKYVYLYYLQDRKILSDRKLEQWFIDKEAVFGRKASLEGFYAITDKLEGWLNGDIFPIPRKGEAAPEATHIQKVAAVFLGDDPDSGQMNLDFKAYDFEHIPIETLSVVYQQFLHSEGKGKKQGAIYTPIHLVNFILDELDARRPFRKGMKGFDPACGSGAFLVQCYRRLIERELSGNPGKKIKPTELRSLLTDHIYGMDVDEDACGITELSLILTLLDYVEPPDLEKPGYKTFKLPALRNRNIFFCKDGFFKPNSDWEKNRPRDGFDWIVGNPPWKKINKNKLERGDSSALDWMEKEKEQSPVSSRQIAEAFAWEITRYLSNKGLVGMLLPAGTLFKTQAKRFRQQFFSRRNVWCIVNFSNLRHLLFQSSTNPAAAFFYSISKKDGNDSSSYIVTYAPFAVHQLSRYGVENRKDNKLWTIIVNADEIREISQIDAATGSSRAWKLSMWGSVRDKFLLNSLEKRYDSLSVFAKAHGLVIHEGLQLRSQDANEPVELIREVIGKNKLDMSSLRECGRIFSFPDNALKPVEDPEAYVRKGRGVIPLKICYPPHIIVDQARRFAVFSDKFIVVPPRQIGIKSKPSNDILLKALSLYLSSDFALYHQLFSSPFWGIERDVFDKNDIENLPIPIDALSSNQFAEWATLYDELARAKSANFEDTFFSMQDNSENYLRLMEQLNKKVYALMGINQTERWLIQDLLQVRKNLNEGRIAKEAVKPADEVEMMEYAKVLKKELDNFLDKDIKNQHRITVYYSNDLAIIKLEHPLKPPAGPVKVVKVTDQKTEREFNKIKKGLLRRHGQWIYFNRNLKLFEGRTTYFVKPRQRLSWLRSQALVDADEFIAEKLTMH
jgi:hypothetical protein